MDFKDVSSRMKQAREKDSPEGEAGARYDYNESYRLRGKMLGVLLRDSRINAARSLEDCARMLNVPPHEVEAWELGQAVPSLPQLEILAYYLDVPVSQFWSLNTLGDDPIGRVDAQSEYMKLRTRMIGALLRQAREDARLTVGQVAEGTNLPIETVATYESGEVSIPMHELTVLASTVQKNIPYFLETSSHIGRLLANREDWKHFTELPKDLREFAANPTNIGFIELAYMLSKMPTDKLRKIGESMLEITM